MDAHLPQDVRQERVRSSRVVLSRQCRGQAREATRGRQWQKSWFAGEITEQP